VPPLKGVAVKVTCVPWHTGLAEGAMVTVAGVVGLTIMVMLFELRGLFVAHTAFDVTLTRMLSLFAGT